MNFKEGFSFNIGPNLSRHALKILEKFLNKKFTKLLRYSNIMTRERMREKCEKTNVSILLFLKEFLTLKMSLKYDEQKQLAASSAAAPPALPAVAQSAASPPASSAAAQTVSSVAAQSAASPPA